MACSSRLKCHGEPGFELWATMKSLGQDGIDEMILGMHERAQQFKVELENADFAVLNEVVLSSNRAL